MVALSVQIETAGGLSWERWQRIVPLVERLGYRGLYLCDHFCPPGEGFANSVEITLAFAYLATRSRRLEFGSLVAPVSFRDPVFLVRQAMHLDNLSGGRMVLGVGAGWMEREHRAFGYELGDTRTRLDRLAEALEVMTLLARHEEPVSFGGRFYRLEGAKILPRAARPDGPRIMVGGSGPRRTLPLAARYADVWNAGPRPAEAFAESSTRLDELLVARGRAPAGGAAHADATGAVLPQRRRARPAGALPGAERARALAGGAAGRPQGALAARDRGLTGRVHRAAQGVRAGRRGGGHGAAPGPR